MRSPPRWDCGSPTTDEAAAKGLITELAQLGDSTSRASIAYCTRIRGHFEQLPLTSGRPQGPSWTPPTPRRPGSATPPSSRCSPRPRPAQHGPGGDPRGTVRRLPNPLHLPRRQKAGHHQGNHHRQHPGIAAAHISDPRTKHDSPKGSPAPFGKSNTAAIATPTPTACFSRSCVGGPARSEVSLSSRDGRQGELATNILSRRYKKDLFWPGA
jgi:hypothetical protein